MLLEDINKILEKGEGINIEFKEAQQGIPKDFWESVISFSNTDGGIILLGVNDDGKVLGLDKSLILKYQKEIVTNLKNRENIDPPLYLNPTEFNHPDGIIIYIQVPSSSLVHEYAGKVYVRSSDADLDITSDKHRISGLHLRKSSVFTENKIFPYLQYEDLESELFDKARSIIRGFQSGHSWIMADDMQILKESSLYCIDHQTGEKGLTLAAALIFGKDITIQNILPAYKVEAIVRRENLDRYDNRKTFRTNLIDTYLGLMKFIRDELPEKFYLENGQRKDLRELIFREVVGNLIVHREYTSAHSSEIVIYKDKLIETNPNKALFHGPIDVHSFNPYPKNPNIRKFFTAFGWTDEIGSGIRNTTKYLSFYVNGAEPLFYEDDLFRTEIPLVNISLGKFGKKILNWLDLPSETLGITNEGLSKIQLDSKLHDADLEDIIVNLVLSWNKKGTKLKELDWPKIEADFEENLKKVPSISEKGTKLLHKKVRYFIAILLISSVPVQLEEIMKLLGYKNKQTFRKLYFLPLQQVGFIAMLNPDKPNDPNQKYLITEKGKLFLSGKEY